MQTIPVDFYLLEISLSLMPVYTPAEAPNLSKRAFARKGPIAIVSLDWYLQ